MANVSKPIKITITSGVAGQPVAVRNRTTSEVLHTVIEATGKLTFDCQNFTNGFTDGDIIDIVVSGEKMGQGSVTLSGNAPQTVTVGTSSITSGISRGVR